MKQMTWNVALGELLSVEGVVAEDIISKNGPVLLPAGVNLGSLREAEPEIVSLLLKHGITHVRVRSVPDITAGEFRTALRSLVPAVAELNPVLTQLAVSQLGAIYQNIEDRKTRERGIRTMLMIASRLPREIRRTPSITLSMVDSNDREGERDYIHAVNTALLAGYIAQRVFPIWPAFVESCVMGGFFHDIGKAFLAELPTSQPHRNKNILPGETKIYNLHTLLGEALLRDVGVSDFYILSAVRSHHEKWDGSGSPDRLSGEDIPAAGRIVAVADAFENLTSSLLADDPRRSKKAVSTMICMTNSDFDRRIVRALLASIGLYPPGAVVILSDGRIGIVLETKERNLLCPRVLVCIDKNNRRVTPFEILNIHKEGTVYIKEAIDDFGKRKQEHLAAEVVG
ncbi:phosphohydrolase [Synergistales bacterium]|nr:phosphohydrolase [Synergistales bacterium]GHS88089.1 phosphohydrolase [Synergistales bacterium]